MPRKKNNPFEHFPNTAVLGPITHYADRWVFGEVISSISHCSHKPMVGHSSLLMAEQALESLANKYRDEGFVVFRPGSQEDRDAALSFLRQVTECVTADFD
jgi:hypothetical protein